MFRRDYHLQIIGLFLSGFVFMNINVSTFPWSSYLSSTNRNLFVQKIKDSFSFSFNKCYVNFWSRGSTVGIVTKLRPGRSGVRTPGKIGDLSLLRNVMTVSGSHSVDSESLFQG